MLEGATTGGRLLSLLSSLRRRDKNCLALKAWYVSYGSRGSETSRKLTILQNIHQMHRDIVYTWPASVEKLGSSPRCEVQGMYLKGRLIAVQGHPEFNGDIESELLQRRRNQGIFNDEQYEEGMSRVRNPHDGVKVAAAFLRFLFED